MEPNSPRSVLGGHSHDAADQIDDALEANAAGRRALLVSLAGLGLTAAVQGVVVAFSGSVALLGDTFHNVADALTAVPLLIAFALGRRAASKRFTYGYGRAEDLAGLFVIAMIALSAVLAAYEAVRRLLQPQDVNHLWAVAAAAVVGFLGNELVARYRIRVGRQIGSAALVADGLHARTDGFTSLAVLLGAGGAALGWRWADPVVGLLITVAIVGVLRSAVVQVGARLMDAVDPSTVDQALEAIRTVDGVEGVADLRMRWIGHSLRAEADVTVDPRLTVVEGHDLAHHVEEHLVAYVGRLDAAIVHVSPRTSGPVVVDWRLAPGPWRLATTIPVPSAEAEVGPGKRPLASLMPSRRGSDRKTHGHANPTGSRHNHRISSVRAGHRFRGGREG